MKTLNEQYSPRAVAEVVFKTCCPGYSPEYTADVVERLISRIEQAITDERERCAKIAEEYARTKFRPEGSVPLFHRGDEEAAAAIAKKIREGMRERKETE